MINLSEAYSEIEGDWKSFRFRRIVENDWTKVFEHLAQNFVKDEPTCKLLGYSDEFAADFNKLAEAMLADNMSFLAEDKEKGEIAGVRVTFHHRASTSFENVKIKSRNAKLILKLVGDAESVVSIPEKLGVNEWAEFFAASTSPKYRNQGLASEFYRRSIKFLTKAGFKYALVIVSSPYTRAATERQEFMELSKFDYHDFYGFNGKRVFSDDQLTSEHYACVRAKLLH